ncbi:hypothetical protein CYMTET_35560, partial [Cymbomonas tetramitiformis]
IFIRQKNRSKRDKDEQKNGGKRDERGAADTPIKRVREAMMAPLNPDEVTAVFKGIEMFGRDWERIAERCIPDRHPSCLPMLWTMAARLGRRDHLINDNLNIPAVPGPSKNFKARGRNRNPNSLKLLGTMTLPANHQIRSSLLAQTPPSVPSGVPFANQSVPPGSFYRTMPAPQPSLMGPGLHPPPRPALYPTPPTAGPAPPRPLASPAKQPLELPTRPPAEVGSPGPASSVGAAGSERSAGEVVFESLLSGEVRFADSRDGTGTDHFSAHYAGGSCGGPGGSGRTTFSSFSAFTPVGNASGAPRGLPVAEAMPGGRPCRVAQPGESAGSDGAPRQTAAGRSEPSPRESEGEVGTTGIPERTPTASGRSLGQVRQTGGEVQQSTVDVAEEEFEREELSDSDTDEDEEAVGTAQACLFS